MKNMLFIFLHLVFFFNFSNAIPIEMQISDVFQEKLMTGSIDFELVDTEPEHPISSIYNSLEISVIGTGRTTGHIAELSIQNNSDEPIAISPQIFFIPSRDRYQGYVGRIPDGIIIAPKQSGKIPVNGYCADVHSPPVTAGEPMPPIDDWIPVAAPQVPEPMNPPGGKKDKNAPVIVSVLQNTLPAFEQDDIPNITDHTSFVVTAPKDSSSLTITWPGTSEAVGGSFDPNDDPKSFGPVLVKYLEKIEEAAILTLEDPNIITPFSNDPKKEKEAIIQQCFWIVTAGISEDEYTKEDFSNNVYKQFAGQSTDSVISLPEDQTQRIDQGVDQFWDVFTAVGVEAKVFSHTPEGSEIIVSEEEKPRCKSNGITFDIHVTKEFGGQQVEVYSESVAAKTKKFPIPVDIHTDEAEFTVKISDIKANCFCECEDENQECEFYPRIKGKSDADLTKPGKIRIRGISSKNTEVVEENEMDAVDEFEIELTVIDKEKDFEMSFKMTGYCINDNCIRASLNKKITLEFDKKKDEKEKK